MKIDSVFSFRRLFLIITVMLISMAEKAFSQAEQHGKASFYADKFEGKMTAGGVLFSQDSLTAAHPTFPFGTKVKVTNSKNDKFVVVVINDRGPNVHGRIIDLSKRAMLELDGVQAGVIKVKIEVLSD